MYVFKSISNLLFITAAIILIGDILPWVKAGPISVDGIDTDDGTLMLWIVIALVGVGFIAMRKARIGAILGGLLSLAALIVAIYDINQASGSKHTEIGNIDLTAGIGLYVCIIGALVGLYAGFIGIRERRNTLTNA